MHSNCCEKTFDRLPQICTGTMNEQDIFVHATTSATGSHLKVGEMSPSNAQGVHETETSELVNSHLLWPGVVHQHAPAALEDDAEECNGDIRVPSGSGYRIMTPFPWRLHKMLEELERKKMNWIVSWMPDGKAFQVHSPDRFEDTIIPMYFRHKRYKSFQVRQNAHSFSMSP